MNDYAFNTLGEYFFYGYALISMFSLCIYFMLMGERPCVQWAQDTAAGTIIGLTGLFCMFMSIPWMLTHFGALAPVFVAAFGYGVIRLPVYVWGSKLGETIVSGGSTSNIRNLPTGDRARAALARGDAEAAEKLFREDMTSTPKHDTLLHLALGNLYRDQKRLKETIAEWQLCLQGEPPADIYLTTSMRLAELLDRHLGKGEDARDILARALKKYPNESEASALKKRLKNLS